MSTNLTFATCGFSQGIRFVLVNNRVPRTDERCALCAVALSSMAMSAIHRRG
jgi:hypothetical protein